MEQISEVVTSILVCKQAIVVDGNFHAESSVKAGPNRIDIAAEADGRGIGHGYCAAVHMVFVLGFWLFG